MKIDDILFGQQTGNKTTNRKEATDTNFKDLLNNQVQPADASHPLASTNAVTPTAAISATLRLEGLQLSEKTIDSLESFSAALEDTTIAAEDLEPFVDALEEETSALLDLQQDLPQDDPLAKLLNRIATVAYIESSKFRRGDYNA